MNQYESIDPYGTYDVKGLNPYEMAMKMASWNNELRSTLSKTNEDLSNVESTIVQQADAIALRVLKEDYTGEVVASMIALDPYAVTIIATSLNITGYVTFTDLSQSGRTVINGANIMTGTILADRIGVTELSAITANLGYVNAGYIYGVAIEGGTISGATIYSTGSYGTTILTGASLTNTYANFTVGIGQGFVYSEDPFGSANVSPSGFYSSRYSGNRISLEHNRLGVHLYNSPHGDKGSFAIEANTRFEGSVNFTSASVTGLSTTAVLG